MRRFLLHKNKRMVLCIFIFLMLFLPYFMSESSQCTFTISDNQYLKASFSASFECNTPKTKPGESVSLKITARGGNANITANYQGKSYPYTFNTPLGHQKVPIEELFVGSLYLNIGGSLRASIHVEGPVEVDKSSISWSTWGTQEVTLSVSSEAMDGDEIHIDITPSYIVTPSLFIEVMGREQSIWSDSYTLSKSHPMTITLVVGQGGSSLSLPEDILMYIVVAVVAIILLSIFFYARSRRKEVTVAEGYAPQTQQRDVFSLELPVHKARRDDIGKNIIRLDKKTREKLGVKKGDPVYVQGETQIITKVAPAHREDIGKRIVRMNKRLREKVGIPPSGRVTVRKVN